MREHVQAIFNQESEAFGKDFSRDSKRVNGAMFQPSIQEAHTFCPVAGNIICDFITQIVPNAWT